MARPLVLKSFLPIAGCESISRGGVNINLAFSAAPPLRDPGDFYACFNLPGQWSGPECVCFKMTVVMHEEDAPGCSPPSLGEVNSSHRGISDTVMFRKV